MSRPKAGDRAPALNGTSGDGKALSLAELLARGPVMVVFYPGDETPVCTAQLCDYRNRYADFQAMGIQIVGVSSGSVRSKEKFASHHGFPFPLVADEDGTIARTWGMRNFLGMTDRGNFLVAPDGKVVYAHKEAIPLFRRKSDELIEAARRHFGKN